MKSHRQSGIDEGDGAVAVLGLGASGEAAARLLLDEGRSVLAIDSGAGDALERRAAELRAQGADVRLSLAELPRSELAMAVASPGVPPDSRLRIDCVERGIPLVSEIEMAWSRIEAPTIAVTGSNGKSSLVKCIAAGLGLAGCSVGLGGNYGVPASELARRRNEFDWLVLELSSFQLETIIDFRPDISVLLNIFPNHLDRHGDMLGYRALKERIFANCGSEDRCIFPAELQPPPELGAGNPRWTTFGDRAPADWIYTAGRVDCAVDPQQRWHRGNVSVDKAISASEPAEISGSYFDNRILGKAAAAALAVCDAAGIDACFAIEALRSFEPLPHRVRTVAELDGVSYIDDSKATNLAAMCAAIEMVAAPIRLIAVGRGKGEDLHLALPLLRSSVVKAYLIGENAEKMREIWSQTLDCELCVDLKTAVSRAREESSAGDAVLLSPACASFDQFTDFAQRGDFFINYINSLVKAGYL